MRKLCLVALLAGVLSQTSGCIISTDDDDGAFFLTWTLTFGNTVVSCEDAGAGGVAVLATPVGTMVGIKDVFACEPGQGTTADLPPDDYTVVVSILEEGTDDALGTSQPRSASIFSGEVTDLGEFEFSFIAEPGDGGLISLR